jgi:hypothetical protein
MAETKYDLKEKIWDVPGHAHDIEKRLGNYIVRTSGVKELVFVKYPGNESKELGLYEYYKYTGAGNKIEEAMYEINGELLIRKMKKTGTRKKYFISGSKVPVESVEWECKTKANLWNGHLYQARFMAENIVKEAGKIKSLEDQGIKIEYNELKRLLDEALKDYIIRANYFFEDTKQFSEHNPPGRGRR